MQIDNKYNDWLLLYIYESTDNFNLLSRVDFEKRLASSKYSCEFLKESTCSKYEKVDLILKDNRIIRNVILFEGKYVSSIFRYVAKGMVARDRLSNYGVSLNPTIYDKFDFQPNDIIEIRIQPDNLEHYFFGLLKKRRMLKELEIETWMDNK